MTSYGWYLWHWPFIAIAASLWQDDTWILVIAAIAALGPTAISYRWVEQPIRTSNGSRRRLTVGMTATAAAVFCLAAGSQVGATSRWGLDVDGYIERDGVAYTTGCHGVAPWPIEDCTFPVTDARGQIVVVGDSHAASLADGLIAAGNELGYTVVVVTRCPLVADVTFHLIQCHTYREAIEPLMFDPTTRLVVAAHRSTRYVSPPVNAASDDDRPLFDPSGAPVTDHERAVSLWADGLQLERSRLAEAGIDLVSIDVVPEFRTTFGKSIRLVTPHPAVTTITREQLEERRGTAVAAEHSVLEPGHWIDPAEVLCDARVCSSVDYDGQWRYFDDNHLNATGSMELRPLFVQELSRVLNGN